MQGEFEFRLIFIAKQVSFTQTGSAALKNKPAWIHYAAASLSPIVIGFILDTTSSVAQNQQNIHGFKN